MIDPQHYPVLAEAIEVAFSRTVAVKRTDPITIVWHDGQPAESDEDINAACQTWLDGAQARLRQAAIALLSDAKEQLALVDRAIVLLALDVTNALATKINAILDAIDGASTLAQVKTAIAAIADAPTYTPAQARTAINNKLTAGDADT